MGMKIYKAELHYAYAGADTFDIDSVECYYEASVANFRELGTRWAKHQLLLWEDDPNHRSDRAGGAA